MDYYGLYDNGGVPDIGLVDRGEPGYPVGWAYTRPAPDPADRTGATHIDVLALDFLVNPSIERAEIKGAGSKMMKLAHDHYAGAHEGVVGEWYTLTFYADASTKRPGMSGNLAKYVAERKAGKKEDEAAMETWTCKRVKDLYGGADLEMKVKEFRDVFDPDLASKWPDEMIVQVVMKPKE
jgi:hypothetical protein